MINEDISEKDFNEKKVKGVSIFSSPHERREVRIFNELNSLS